MTSINAPERVDFNVRLTVLSALHIGNGEVKICPLDDQTKVAEMQRGGEKNEPYIPGSTLKGALRSIAVDLELSEADALFGSFSNLGSCSTGALIVRGSIQGKEGDASGLPSANDGTFVSRRTAINQGAGVADPNKLFSKEFIAPGAEFTIRLRIETRKNVKKLEAALMQILAAFCSPDGVSIGSDQADGLGRVQLSAKVDIVDWMVDYKGAFVTKSQKRTHNLEYVEPKNHKKILKLICPGPYLSKDPSLTEGPSEREGEPQIRALRRKNEPYITGSSVSGVLRARLEWLKAVNDPDIEHLRSPLHKKSQIPKLHPSERLFGVPGWRGLLQVYVMEVKRKSDHRTTSVKIDRFSGAPIDNALFTTDLDYGVQMQLSLQLDARAEPCDFKELEDLQQDIKANGLQLGYGINHGFGWFEVVE